MDDPSRVRIGQSLRRLETDPRRMPELARRAFREALRESGVTIVSGSGSDSRALVPTASRRVNTKSPTVHRIVLSRRSVVAMIRGVSCALAT